MWLSALYSSFNFSLSLIEYVILINLSHQSWRCDEVIITTIQLKSGEPELRLCAILNPVYGLLEVCNGMNLRLLHFCWSIISEKRFIMIIIIVVVIKFHISV